MGPVLEFYLAAGCLALKSTDVNEKDAFLHCLVLKTILVLNNATVLQFSVPNLSLCNQLP